MMASSSAMMINYLDFNFEYNCTYKEKFDGKIATKGRFWHFSVLQFYNSAFVYFSSGPFAQEIDQLYLDNFKQYVL